MFLGLDLFGGWPRRCAAAERRREVREVRCGVGLVLPHVWELVWLNRARIAVQSDLFGRSPEMCTWCRRYMQCEAIAR